MSGKLYIVGTPIGNLKDITLRALEALKECDIVAAEDTRVTAKLLNAYEIKKHLLSYHKFNEYDRSEEIIKLVQEGKIITLVTDAGMPGISDPGCVVIERAVAEGVDIEVIPGVTAVITALVYSTIDTTKFAFRGFFPRENKDREALYEEIKGYRDTLIFYESPHRLLNALEFIREKFKGRKIAICRELTKLYESIFRGTVDEAYEFFCSHSPRGEFVLILEGKTDEAIEKEKLVEWESLSIEEHILKSIGEGLSKKDAIKKVAKDRGLAKSEVYKYSIDI